MPGSLRPVDITYEAAHEDWIAVAVGRLDELGDEIDGTLGVEEPDGLITSVGREQ